MQQDDVLEYLAEKHGMIADILGRAIHKDRKIYFHTDDEASFRKTVFDLKGFFDDELIPIRDFVQALQSFLLLPTEYGMLSYHCIEGVLGVVSSVIDRVQRKPEILKDGPSSSARAIRAYKDLDLHPEIERMVSKLFQDGHYANAVESAVKALNGLVRLRSDLEQDGTTLMERAFSPKSPILSSTDW